jgi:uncharacterized protein
MPPGRGTGVQPVHEAPSCPYCGAPLSAFYYFCLACGTPYKPIDTTLTPARPRQLSDEELVRMKAPQVATLFWSYFSVVIGVGIFTALFFREERPDLHLLLNETAILITTCIFGWRYRKSLSVQLHHFGFDRPDAWLALAMLVPLLLINYVYHGFIVEALKDKGVNLLHKLRGGGISEGALIGAFCFCPAVLEEIAYRGLLQHWLQTAIVPWKALVVASFLFAATHLSVVSLPYLFLVGLLLGWAKQRTDSLYPSMLIHFLHNLAVIELFPFG